MFCHVPYCCCWHQMALVPRVTRLGSPVNAVYTVSRIGKSHMKTGFFQLWFLKKKIWSKYTLGIVVSWYNLRNCNIWLFLWHLSPQSGPFHQFWSFLLILFSKTTQKKSKHYSGRAFLEVFGKCVGLGLSSSIQRPQKY